MPRRCVVGPIPIGPAGPLAIIAGPCVLESYELGLTVGRVCRDLCRELGLSYIFKASFDKANRSSIHSARGPGLERGVAWLADIGRELGVPTTTDIHEPAHAEPVARVVDLIQIPAFLCRQTDLLLAAGRSAQRFGRAVNVKKGQFMAPGEMAGPVKKLREAGTVNLMLTERGTFFGYHRLVNDFIGVADLLDAPASGPADQAAPAVCFDCTHSTQLPGAGEQTGGRPERAPALARAAAAVGVDALFIECHPDPAHAFSDASTQQPLDRMPSILRSVAAIHAAAR